MGKLGIEIPPPMIGDAYLAGELWLTTAGGGGGHRMVLPLQILPPSTLFFHIRVYSGPKWHGATEFHNDFGPVEPMHPSNVIPHLTAADQEFEYDYKVHFWRDAAWKIWYEYFALVAGAWVSDIKSDDNPSPKHGMVGVGQYISVADLGKNVGYKPGVDLTKMKLFRGLI